MTLYSYITSHFMFIILSFHLIVITLAHSSGMLCHDHERSALLHFKQSMSLNNSASSNFLAYSKTESWKVSGGSSADCCSWDGVECDDHTGYIIGLHLSSSLLYGTLHYNSTLFNLVHLQTLNLADNHFRNSSIPAEVSQLSSLSRLNLSHSAFSGPIPPGLSRSSKLTSLDLSKNYLYGVFPIDIFHLPNMLVINVSYNNNLTGLLPEFNRTSSFRELELGYTNFSGNLPVSIGNLQSLTKLQIRDCYFSGLIPASIANLTHLTYLSLTNNVIKISGKLSWLEKLTKLTFLSLENINLYGDIPSTLANLTQLTHLDLASNHLAGETPSWLMNMTHLIELDLSYNELTGPIPGSFSLLKNLEYLNLRDNNLTGAVDADIFLSLRKLIYLGLSFNKITLHTHYHINFTYPNLQVLQLNECNLRKFPYFLKFQNNLELLFLAKNNIHGTIPHWIWNVSNHLEAVKLSDNFLTSIEHNPTALPDKSLRVISLRNNMLQGNLPVPPPNIVVYAVSNNRLSGNIPPLTCGGMSLRLLDLSHNNLSGPIPPNLSSSLTSLILQGNNLSGTIPQIYTEECQLKVMELSQNQLQGKVPKLLSNCKMLQILDVSDNQLDETFPNWLGSLPLLQVLLLHSNKFHGVMGSPKSPTDFQMLRIVDLSHNSFTGDLPVEYIQIWNAMKVYRQDKELYVQTGLDLGTQHFEWHLNQTGSIILTNKGVKREYEKILNIFTDIDLSDNKFIGQIPDSLGSLEGLQSLNLSNNELTGPIPRSIANLKQLESLDLSQNKLSGVIPQQLASQLTFLAFFNVSYNRLCGPIPQGRQFETFDKKSYIANSGLCGLPVSEKCGTLHSQPGDDEEDDSDDINEFPSGFDWILILAGVGSGLIVGFVMGNILTDRYWWLMVQIIQCIRHGPQNLWRHKRQIHSELGYRT